MTDRAQDTEAIRAARSLKATIVAALPTSELVEPGRVRLLDVPQTVLDARAALDVLLDEHVRLVARLEAAERALRGIGELTVAEHAKGHVFFHVANRVAATVEDALAAAAPGETTRGGLIHTPTTRVMGVDAPDLGDPIGGAAPGETEQTP